MDGELLSEPTEYRSIDGALQHLIMSRPNIAYAVNLVSQFMHALLNFLLCREFWDACKHCQLSDVSKKVGHLNVVVTYSDVDWVGCPNSSRSTTGYAMFLGSNLIS